MEIVKEKTMCFTGHRPEKIIAVIGNHGPAIDMIKSLLYYQIVQAINEGFTCFMSGMARGVDIWAAKYVIELKNKFSDIKLIGVKPYLGQHTYLKGTELWEIQNVLDNTDEIINVSKEYSKDCFKKRNYFMVDNSARLVAVVDDYRSGTGQTINYANKKGIDVRTINIREFASEEFCKKIQNPSLIKFE